MEHNDNTEDFLHDLEARFIERRASRYVKKVKAGRAAIFIIALFSLVTIMRSVEAYEQNAIKIKMAAAVAIFYFVLFVWSLQRSFIPMAIATITSVLLAVYNTIAERYMYKFILDDDVLGIQRIIFVIVIIVRLMLFYYLAMGTYYAHKFDALYANDDDVQED